MGLPSSSMSLIREPMLGVRIDAVLQAADAHHVATLLIVGILVEQVVGNVFENFLDARAAHVVQRD